MLVNLTEILTVQGILQNAPRRRKDDELNLNSGLDKNLRTSGCGHECCPMNSASKKIAVIIAAIRSVSSVLDVGWTVVC